MVQKRKGKYRILKWAGAIIAFIIILAAGISVYLSSKWKPLLTEKIKEGIYNSSRHLYRIDFKDIHLNLITGSASLDSVSLTPDTAVFNQLKKINKAPVHLFSIKLARLQLRRIGILTAYFKKRVNMNEIILDRPSINMTHFNVQKQRDTLKDDQTLYSLISKTLKSVHVNAIKIRDADFDYINGTNSKPLNSIKHLNAYVKDLLIDSLSQFDTTRFYYTKDIGFELTGYQSKGKMYTIKADTIKGSAIGKTIKVSRLKIIPLYPDLTFTRKYKYGKDRYDLTFDHIDFTGVDFMKFNKEGEFRAAALTVGPAKVNVFVNRELPPPPNFDKARNFPHIALKRAPAGTTIDSIKLTKIDVAYTEYNPISLKRGTVYFQDLSGNILNVTNDSVQLARDNHAVASLTARVMKTSRIDIVINFNLTDKNAAFGFKGNVAPMDMMVLNPMAKNMGLVEIESGRMQKAAFNIAADKYGSSGTVDFYYQDLKIKLLKEEEDGKAAKTKGLLSFLANSLLIKNANPSEGETARTSKVIFQRTPAASFFNLLWKSVFTGMRDIVGLSIVPPKTPEQAMEKIKDKKQERQEKREKRRKERAEKKAEKNKD